MTKKQGNNENNEADEAADAIQGDGFKADPGAEKPAAIGRMTAIKRDGLHEQLEAAELAAIGTTHEYAQALNRVTLLTGTLKTVLPGAIASIEDEDLRAGLRNLLAIL